jgi:O-antigen/teichoic acid export membrane protein
VALALQALVSTIASVTAGCQDTVRGFERTDIAARTLVAQPLLNLVILVPVLALGGGLKGALLATAAVNSLVLAFVVRALRPAGVGALRVSGKTVKILLLGGWPFLFFGVTMALQPNIDALFLSKLAPPQVVGWHAAAVKLLGALVFPAAALISALYPTLCRLHAEDQTGFRETASGALRTASLLAGPLAFGTFLFADDAIRIFSRVSFGPAADNLRFLAPLVLLMYFSMPLGSSLLAAGRQRAWAGVQTLCVVTSLVLDPLLVPWFQLRRGNGGLGICVATVLSEVLMVTGGLWLLPKGIVNRALARSIGLTLASGVVMAVVARQLSGSPAWIAAPCAVLAYLASLWAMGGVDQQQLALVRSLIAQKMGRAESPR